MRGLFCRGNFFVFRSYVQLGLCALCTLHWANSKSVKKTNLETGNYKWERKFLKQKFDAAKKRDVKGQRRAQQSWYFVKFVCTPPCTPQVLQCIPNKIEMQTMLVQAQSVECDSAHRHFRVSLFIDIHSMESERVQNLLFSPGLPGACSWKMPKCVLKKANLWNLIGVLYRRKRPTAW